MKTLEKPTPKKSPAQAMTPFLERSGQQRHSWLGNRRWSAIPRGAIPSHERIMQVVTDSERSDAARILKVFREAEALAAKNGIGTRTAKILALEGTSGQAPDESAAAAQKLRVERDKLRNQALGLAKTILERCVDSFEAELQETAIAAEARLQPLGIDAP